MSSILFPFHQFWWLYLSFTAGVVLLLSLDLGLFHRRAHVVSYREATTWTIIWVALALSFAAILYLYAASVLSPLDARRLTFEFLTGYVIEESLSIDNMFVFALVFRYLAVPPHLQHRVLFYGIAGALVFRSLLIAAGAALMQFDWVTLLFGVFLVITGLRMLKSGETAGNLENSRIHRWVSRLLPTTNTLDGQKFFSKAQRVRRAPPVESETVSRRGALWAPFCASSLEAQRVRRAPPVESETVSRHTPFCASSLEATGSWKATPLLVALLILEVTDIVFAIDSVPAIFAVTTEPFIVFTSNVLAILGLRSLYFLLAGALGQFHLLRYGLSIVLIFVGLKMAWLDDLFSGHFPIGVSLLIITLVLGATLILSVLYPAVERKESPSGGTA